ncbi:TBC1 domain member 31, variant 2 [Clonorchis sinensis]|uniref:TBC1 domain family member 31 n=1 Tax=Clonorchis sinensis TaxID=79923 RepID=A0A8T1M745_CLOSI|nr:TBC1 domain member 31, variant 2 [Clonorchis sinensis]
MCACIVDVSVKRRGIRSARSNKYGCFGKLLSFCHSDKKSVGRSGTGVIQPTALAFSNGGSNLFCAYHNGDVYALDFIHDRCRLVANLSQNITAICGQHDKNRLLVGLQNTNIHILDIDTGREHGILRGHTSHIQSISTQTSGIYGISVGSNEAILWSLRTLEKRCKLHIEPDTNVTSVFFLPPHDSHILSCLRNGSVYVWDADKLECCYHLSGKEHGLLNYQTVTTTSGGLFLFAAGRSPFIHLWCLDHLHDKDLLPSAKSTTGQLATGEGDRELMEVIRLPKPAYSVRRLAWLPNPSSCISSDNCQIHVDELDGILLALGNDHRVRFLKRFTNEGRSSVSAGDTRDTVRWHCLFTVGRGTLDDPLIMNLIVPQPIRSSIGTTLACTRGQTAGSYVALLDLQGYVHLHDLSVALDQLYKPPPSLLNVAKEEKYRRRVRSIPVVEFKPVKPAPSKTDSLLTQNGFQCSTLGRHTGVHTNLYADPDEGLLNRGRLRSLLREFGRFPDKYRTFIWRSVLQLPSNTQAFDALVKKGIHPAFATIPPCFRSRQKKSIGVLQKVCSALAFWSPMFGETDWLLMMAYPFVRLFENNSLRAFEVVATVLNNWCELWFRDFPNPPANILCIVDCLVKHFDPELHSHFTKCHVTTEMYAWPLFQTVLSELFTQEEWLQLWDTVICYPPGFLIACVAAYAVCGRRLLLPVQNVDAFEAFFRSPTTIPVRTVVDLAHQLLHLCPPTIHPDRVLVNTLRSESFLSQDSSGALDGLTSIPFRPLTSPYYPIVIPPSDFIRRNPHKGVKKEMDETHRTMRRSTSLDPITAEDAKLHEHRKTFAALLRQVNSHEKHLADELPHSRKSLNSSDQSASTKRNVSSSSNSVQLSASDSAE